MNDDASAMIVNDDQNTDDAAIDDDAVDYSLRYNCWRLVN